MSSSSGNDAISLLFVYTPSSPSITTFPPDVVTPEEHRSLECYEGPEQPGTRPVHIPWKVNSSTEYIRFFLIIEHYYFTTYNTLITTTLFLISTFLPTHSILYSVECRRLFLNSALISLVTGHLEYVDNLWVMPRH